MTGRFRAEFRRYSLLKMVISATVGVREPPGPSVTLERPEIDRAKTAKSGHSQAGFTSKALAGGPMGGPRVSHYRQDALIVAASHIAASILPQWPRPSSINLPK